MTKMTMVDTAAPGAGAVYVVDDDPRVRMSVTDMVEGFGYQAWSFPGGVDLLRDLDRIDSGCLLLDVQMPGMDGLQVMEELVRRDYQWPVIVMTAHADVPMAVTAMKLGALEFIEKPFDAGLLAPALARAFARLAELRAARDARILARKRLAAITPRERSILHELVRGKPNKIIAFDLGLSIRTVEMHRSNILNKLDINTINEAIAILIGAEDGFEVTDNSYKH